MFIGDRGHESYSGTKISEIYSDATSLFITFLAFPLVIDWLLGFDLAFSLKLKIVILFLYLYLLAWVLDFLIIKFRGNRKLKTTEE